MAKTIQDFAERWRKKVEEIKKQSFDREQCQSVMSGFEAEGLWLHIYKADSGWRLPEFQEIGNDLRLALNIAYSNFRKEKKGFWSKIFGGQKEFSLFKIK